MKNILILGSLIALVILVIVFLGYKQAESPTTETETVQVVEEPVVTETVTNETVTNEPVVNEETNEVESQEKIDATVACRTAIAYMSFKSGEEANLFIEECIAGKHPEVIERYKAEMQMESGATI